MNKTNLKWSFVDSVGVFVYVAIVAFIMQNAEKIFGKMQNVTGPISFLLLFVLSATITGSLVLGRPVLMYLDGQKKEAIQLVLYTIGWLFLLTVLALAMNIVF